MRINYNFAFKDSKLRPWERPAPPNLLLTDASLEKKYELAIGDNLNQFISILSDKNIDGC